MVDGAIKQSKAVAIPGPLVIHTCASHTNTSAKPYTGEAGHLDNTMPYAGTL